MSLLSLISILQLATSCKDKSVAIFSETLDEHTLEINCHYYIALLDAIYSIEEGILSFQGNKDEELHDIDLMADIMMNIRRCSEIEDRLSQRISMTTH